MASAGRRTISTRPSSSATSVSSGTSASSLSAARSWAHCSSVGQSCPSSLSRPHTAAMSEWSSSTRSWWTTYDARGSRPVIATVTGRARSAEPDALVWSSVRFQTSTPISPDDDRDERASTSEPAPSPVSETPRRVSGSRSSRASAHQRGLRSSPTVRVPKPPCSSAGGRPSSSKWSETTQYDSDSILGSLPGPIAEAMPRSRKVPAKTASLTSLKWVGVTPHSVHQIGVPSRP